MNTTNLRRPVEFFSVALVPILALILPFLPNFYDALTEPDDSYAYSTEYTKNPVLEWNRSMERFLKRLDSASDMNSDSFTRPLLKKIGKEITQSLPAILSETSFRPMDRYTVSIANMSSKYDLKNVKVHFLGCIGVDSLRTYPDTEGSIKELKNSDLESISTAYGQINRTVLNGRGVAYISIYAEDASKCSVIVEAQTPKGETATGKRVNEVAEYNTSEFYKKEAKLKNFDLIWKIFMTAFLVYVFFYVRSLRIRLPP